MITGHCRAEVNIWQKTRKNLKKKKLGYAELVEPAFPNFVCSVLWCEQWERSCLNKRFELHRAIGSGNHIQYFPHTYLFDKRQYKISKLSNWSLVLVSKCEIDLEWNLILNFVLLHHILLHRTELSCSALIFTAQHINLQLVHAKFSPNL